MKDNNEKLSKVNEKSCAQIYMNRNDERSSMSVATDRNQKKRRAYA